MCSGVSLATAAAVAVAVGVGVAGVVPDGSVDAVPPQAARPRPTLTTITARTFRSVSVSIVSIL